MNLNDFATKTRFKVATQTIRKNKMAAQTSEKEKKVKVEKNIRNGLLIQLILH